jgi:hypothetical protein
MCRNAHYVCIVCLTVLLSRAQNPGGTSSGTCFQGQVPAQQALAVIATRFVGRPEHSTVVALMLATALAAVVWSTI